MGFQQYFIQHGEEFNSLRSIYRTIQIFTLEGGDLEKPIPWILHIVRFTAPSTAIMAFIMALLEIFKEQWKRLGIRRLRNHVVIIGLGTKGKNVLDENIRKNKKVLVIENDPLNPDLESLKQSRCHHIQGNANNLDILIRARITHAESVYLLMGDDTQQVKASLLIYQLVKDSNRDKDNPVNCMVHLLKQEFLTTLRSHNLFQNINDGLALTIFNVYENSARELFQESPPDSLGISKESNLFVQILIFGFGQAGEALALQTAITGHYLNRDTRLPKVVIFDRLASEKEKDFLHRYPSFTDYCEFEAIPFEANNPQLISTLLTYLENPDALNSVVLCFDNKTNNMLLGLQIDSIENIASGYPFKVFIRTDDDEDFAKYSDKIKPYGLPSKVCSKEVIVGGALDKMAMAVQGDYYQMRRPKPDFGDRPADVPWENLPQEYKDSNRKAADHIGVKIRGLGYVIAPEYNEEEEPDLYTTVTLSKEEIEMLAQLEHVRWMAERLLAGWKHDSVRNDKVKRTPYLVDWKDLDEGTRDYDRGSIENIPNILQKVKLRIAKKN